MKQSLPWVSGPIELLRHAEGHFKKGLDVDRRMALISFDNSIEISCVTYLDLHPSQRNGVTYENKKVEVWKKDFHTKLDFLYDFINRIGIEIKFSREELIYYHGLRNNLYHGNLGVTPDLEHVTQIREAAFWVFNILYNLDAEDLLKSEALQPDPVPMKNVVEQSSELSFMESFIQLRKDVNLLLSYLDPQNTTSSSNIDVSTGLTFIAAKDRKFHNKYEDIIEKAELIRDEIVNNPEYADDKENEPMLRSLSYSLQRASEYVQGRLRSYQIQAIEAAFSSTQQTITMGKHSAGIVYHAPGAGLLPTMIGYISKIYKSAELSSYITVVLTNRTAVTENIFSLLFDEQVSNPLIPKVVSPNNVGELESELICGGPKVIVTTAQKLIDFPSLSFDRPNYLIIAFDFSSLFTLSTVHRVLPQGVWIAFLSSLPDSEEPSRRIFGNLVYKFSSREAIRDGFMLPPKIETRILDMPGSNNLNASFEGQILEIRNSEQGDLFSVLASEQSIHLLAKDILNHFETTHKDTNGKGLVIATSIQAAMYMYKEFSHIRPDWFSDGYKSSIVGLLTSANKQDPQELACLTGNHDYHMSLFHHFADPNNPMKIVICVDMWLGIDTPYLDTVYLCRPLHGSLLLQAIGKVCHIAPGKKQALVVDYVGLTSEFENYYR